MRISEVETGWAANRSLDVLCNILASVLAKLDPGQRQVNRGIADLLDCELRHGVLGCRLSVWAVLRDGGRVATHRLQSTPAACPRSMRHASARGHSSQRCGSGGTISADLIWAAMFRSAGDSVTKLCGRHPTFQLLPWRRGLLFVRLARHVEVQCVVRRIRYG